MARIILIRHCQSSGQAPDAPLTRAGAHAARVLADRLQTLAPDAVYSSPYKRAVMSARPFAQRAGLAIIEEPRLHERVLAEAPLDDWLDHIRRSYGDVDHRPGPGGETLRETQRRGGAAMADIAAAGHRLAVAVSHGNLICAVLRSVDPSFGFEDWRGLRNPDLFELTMDQRRPSRFVRLG
ncbi:MAG TPA: histidine phosphatase family protein [Caulobacteraceae bacterium]|nr:histidine phosphatase family protein [Caulobacteraceae bacterium]